MGLATNQSCEGNERTVHGSGKHAGTGGCKGEANKGVSNEGAEKREGTTLAKEGNQNSSTVCSMILCSSASSPVVRLSDLARFSVHRSVHTSFRSALPLPCCPLLMLLSVAPLVFFLSLFLCRTYLAWKTNTVRSARREPLLPSGRNRNAKSSRTRIPAK